LDDLNQLAKQLLFDTANPAHQNILPNIDSLHAQKLQKYVALLIKWNDVYNLSALKSINDIYILHILDCLAPLHAIQNILTNYAKKLDIIDVNLLEPVKCLDVGSGAGLPALIWAIMLQEKNWEITSIDAVQKKIAFQQQVCLELAIENANPCHQRIENFTGGFNFITARAYSSIEKLFNDTVHLRQLTSPLNGYFLLKGQLNNEILEAKNQYPSMLIERLDIPYLHAERHLLYIPFAAFGTQS
jgi:16S rRNA (guanine527-N7)-methyltransferase